MFKSIIASLACTTVVLGASGGKIAADDGYDLALGYLGDRPKADVISVVVSSPPEFTSWSRFPQGTKWANLAWELKSDDIRTVDVVDVDLFDVDAWQIQEHKKRGRTVICYTSAGTMETWRPDRWDVPMSVQGLLWNKKSSERWFDVRKWEKLKDLMSNRLRIAVDKKCDAIEFDNLDCYQNKCVKNASREKLRPFQIQYNKWLANQAHKKGLAVGFKNAVDLIKEMSSVYDFAINESCTKYNECRLYDVFKDLNKAVFAVEYDKKKYKLACKQAKLYGIAMKVANGSEWKTCNVNKK